MAVVLVVGENSFAGFAETLAALESMPSLTALAGMDEPSLSAAAANAYQNIANLKIEIDEDQVVEGSALLKELQEVRSTEDLTAVMIGELKPKVLSRLIRAQLIEANSVMGGNPVEDRRRAGLISDSAGESTHFFRTSKPLDLPVSRDTANEMRGILSWRLGITR